MKREFKVGDRVKIKDGTSKTNWIKEMSKYINGYGIIFNTDEEQVPPIEVLLELDNKSWFFDEEDLELIEDDEEVKPIIDNVNQPSHYLQCSLECIDAMVMAFGVEMVYDFCICNAWKYMWRYKNKNGVEDVKKARFYINKAKSLIDYKFEWENIEQILTKIEKELEIS